MPDPTPEPVPTADRPTARRRAWRWLRWPLLAGAVLFVAAVAGFVALYASTDLPPLPDPPESSTVLDAEGRTIAVFEQSGRREEVDLDTVAPVVVQALIASEDRRFYEHDGVDPVGTVRALVNNLRGDQLQGGSTITQQLVKNTYLTSERTLSRKVREAVLALKLDRSEDKDRILEHYLTIVYFGRGAYGITSAADAYFATTPDKLTPTQASLLIGLLRRPEGANPSSNPEAATQERNRVLDALAATGELTEAEARTMKAEALGVEPDERRIELAEGVTPFFVEWVRSVAVEQFGEAAVYGSGLQITTTLDLEDQLHAQAAISSALDLPDDPQAALIALDRSGAVKAHVGGRDYDTLKVDLARGKAGGGSGRQPGSTFKPFVLAAALEDGIPLGTTFPGPARVELDAGGTPWVVDNYGGEGYGDVDLETATADSVNTVYAQLMLQVGPDRVADAAARMGIDSDLRPEPSLALGTSEVSVLEMAEAYLTLARDGSRVEPFVILKVEADDRTVFEAEEQDGERVLEEGAARAVNQALQGVIEGGTGTAARLDRPAAGKTGTTQGNGDAWFAGYTPQYAAVVWMGYPEGPQRSMDDVHGRAVTGGSFPAEIWQAFMEAALADVEATDFGPPPEDLLVTTLPAASSTTSGSSTTSTSSTSTTTPSTTQPETVTASTAPPPEPVTTPSLPVTTPSAPVPTTTTTTTEPE